MTEALISEIASTLTGLLIAAIVLFGGLAVLFRNAREN